jgi:branched-chain amino acid aminotransferase
MPEKEKQDLLNPAMFSMKIKTYGDLVQALNRTRMEDSKLAILECCIYPEDVNPMLLRFGSALYASNSQIGDGDHVTAEQINGEHFLKVPKPRSPSKPRLAPLSSSRLVISNGVHEPDHADYNTDCEDPPDLNTDHMLTCFWSASGGWGKPKISRSTSIVLPPTAPSLNYGIQCFEGMKVYRGYDGKLRLFRPEWNCKRLLSSARRIGLPEFDVGELQELIETLVSIDGPKWLPKEDAGSFLYLRPVFIATDGTLGVRSPSKAMLYVVCVKSPPFLHSKGMSLITNPEGVCRAWPGGSGNFKVGGNYAPTIPSFEEATTAGYSQILWLFGDDCRVTEAGVCNFFIVWETEDNRREILTPPLGDGTILPGITRQSVVELAATKLAATGEVNGGQLHVEERKFTIHEIIKASEEGRLLEAFTTGTGVGS